MTARIKVGYALVFALLVAGFGPARAQDQQLPNPALSTPLDAPVPVDPRIRIGYLPNGLRYYIRVNGRPYRRAELRLVVNVGSVVEDDDQIGMAHLLEHMAFNGSRNFAKQDLVKFMESIGMRLGAGVNANTSFDETVYMLHVPTDNPEALSKAFLFLGDVAHGLTLDADAVEKEKGVVLEEWRQGRGADARMRDRQTPVVLQGSRYAQRQPIGTQAAIERFSQGPLRRYYTDWYRPDLMGVIAVGDFNPGDIEKLIKSTFGAIPAADKPRPRPAYPVPDHADTLFAVAADPEAAATVIGIYNMLPLRDQTTVGAYRQMQVERLYTSIMNARLAELTVKPEAPFLRAMIDRGIFTRTKEAATLMALVGETGIERGIDALVTESARAARYGFTPAELEREKRETLRLYESAFAEGEKEESADLAAEFIRNFTQKEPVPGITYEYGLVRRFIPEISLAEVNKVAKEWAGGSRVVVVNAPQKAGLTVPDDARLAAVIKAAAGREIKPYVDVESNKPLLEHPPKPGAIVTETARPEYGLLEWVLSNGARVVLKPTQFKQDEVVLRATSPGGTSLANDADFVAAMTAGQVVSASGLGPFNAIQLRDALAGKAEQVTAFIGESEEGVAGGGSPKDLDTMFQLIYLTFTQPRADATAFKALTEQMRTMLASRQASPDWMFEQTLRTTLAQSHLRARPMTPDLVKEMDLQKSFAFFKDRFADAGDFTFVFAGSFDVAGIKPLVEQYLASLPSSGRKETWRNVGVTPPRGVVEKVVRKGIEPKSQVDIVFTGAMAYDVPNRVELDALQVVLETRLRERLREAMRGTYGAQVEASASKIPEPRYSITIDFGCDPDRTEELVKAMFREIESLKADGPSAKDVDDAKAALGRAHDSDLAVNGRLVGAIADAYENAEDVSTFFTLPGQYAKLTASSIRDAARRYLDTSNYVRVTLLPEKAAPAK